jgi:GTPase SAR1 family protein
LKSYYSTVKGVVLLYDVGKASSYDYLQEVIRELPADLPKIVIGNKIDKARSGMRSNAAAQKPGFDLADSINSGLFTVSAKANLNIVEVFNHLTRKILNICPGTT